jgi:two-component system, NtrC family, nitrogen regulation sensor histidine kinase GlnL
VSKSSPAGKTKAPAGRQVTPGKDNAAHVKARVDPLGLLSALPHPILVLGSGNAIHYANAAAETFFQISSTHLARQTLDDVAGFGSPLVALVGQVRRSGATVNEYGVDVSSPRIHGQRLVDLFGGPLADTSHDDAHEAKDGQILLMMQQRSMAQMIERQLTHRAAARSVSGLAAVLAHEIKNPLSGIRGAAQLIEPGLSDEDQELTRLICAETDRIRDLVDRMEVFGDERPLTKQPINIHSVLDHVKRLGGSGFAQGIRVVEDYDPSLPPVNANRDKLVQAFLNLLKNAAEAIGPERADGRIIITTAFRPGVRLSLPGIEARVSLPLMIAIEDNGPGVPEDLKAHLFDPFVTSKRTGTGLGLAMVAKIVRDHGGIIEWETTPQRTVFRVLLPLDERRARDTPMTNPTATTGIAHAQSSLKQSP